LVSSIQDQVDSLIFGLRIPDRSLRESSTRRLIALGKPAVAPLIAYLSHDDEWARLMAAAALGKIGDPRAVQPLEKALSDPDEGVRFMAQTALDGIRHQNG
jgi:HEAT repeat protein